MSLCKTSLYDFLCISMNNVCWVWLFGLSTVQEHLAELGGEAAMQPTFSSPHHCHWLGSHLVEEVPFSDLQHHTIQALSSPALNNTSCLQKEVGILPLVLERLGWSVFKETVYLGPLKWKWLSCVQLFATPWTTQSMDFSRPEHWSR